MTAKWSVTSSPQGLAKDVSNIEANLCAPLQNDVPQNTVPEFQSHQTPEQVTCQDTIDDMSAESLVSGCSCFSAITEGGRLDGSNQAALRVSMDEATARVEVAALFNVIPRISSKLSSDLHPVYDDTTNSDPFTLNMHPCENVVKEAEKLPDDEMNEGNHPSGTDIVGIGQFSEHGLSVLKQFCTIANTRHKVCSEANWLNHFRCSSPDLVRIQEALWHQPATNIILRFGNKSFDFTSFADLALERYIDSFVIDISIGKYLEEARMNRNDNTLLLSFRIL